MKDYKWVRSALPFGSEGAMALAARSASLVLALSVFPGTARSESGSQAGPLRSLPDVTRPNVGTLNGDRSLLPDDLQTLITLAPPQRLVGSDASAGDYEGSSVAIDGNTLVVAAPFAAPMGRTDAGAAYIFVRNGTSWTQQTKLVAGDGRNGDNFGTRAAIRGDTVLIGAPGADSFGRSNVGAVYAFVRSGTSWSQQAKLVAFDAASDDQFGFAVALDGDVAVVGARSADVGMRKDAGAAYAFARRGTMWMPQGKLVASDGGINDSFGVGVAVSGDTAIIGADFAEIAGKTDAGAAYVFQRGPMGWSQQAKLVATDGQANDWFGRQVALDGNTAVVSALYGDATGKPNSGSAYVFVRSMTGWTQQSKLIATDAQSNDWFGYDVAVSGEQVVVGAPYGDFTMIPDAGSGYSFLRSGTMWTQSNKLNASDPSPSGFFGNGIAVDGDTYLVGAPGRPPGGAAYAFIGRKGNGESCVTATDCGSGFCVDGVCCNSACGGGASDCQACSVAAGAMANGSCSPARGGTVCREAVGRCDQAETCSGNSINCPIDVRQPRGSVCRAASHSCDADETCDGMSSVCPTDASREDGVRCELGSCQLGQCRAEADLSVAWEPATATVSGFTPGEFTLLLQNKGPSAAFDVSLTMESPARSTLSTAELPGWSCTSGGPVIECVVATLPPGDTRVSVKLVPPPALSQFDVTARAASLSTDPDDKNNQATLPVKNDNPLFDQISGGGLGCSVGGTALHSEAVAGKLTLATVAMSLGLILFRRRRARHSGT